MACLLLYLTVNASDCPASMKQVELPDTVDPAVTHLFSKKVQVDSDDFLHFEEPDFAGYRRYRLKYRLPSSSTGISGTASSMEEERTFILQDEPLYQNNSADTLPFYYVFLFRLTLF